MISEISPRYRLEEEIGHGGMGIVYRAVDLHLFEKIVALKKLRPEKAADPILRKRFGAEAQAAAMLSHPAIATLLDFEADGETPFLIYEFVKGKTLRTIQSERALSLREVLSVFRSVAEGLAVAHDGGIVHSDLKPENVMITADGQVKILDFGLARVFTSRTSESDPTQTAWTVEGGVVGTPGYMSPEQIEGDPVDHRSDIFALGIMLYEFAVKQHPFKGKSVHSTLSNILKAEPGEISFQKDSAILPPDLLRVIRKCLRKKRGERYSSMRDLVVDLNDVQREIDSPGSSPAPSQERFAVPYARAKFMLLQCLYVAIYVAALMYSFSKTITDAFLKDLFRLSGTNGRTVIIVLAMCGLAMRAWTLTTVGYRHPDAGIQFRRLFPLLFLLDAAWAASPLLLFPFLVSKGWDTAAFLTLGCVAIMAYLPFSQKTLMESLYPKATGR